MAGAPQSLAGLLASQPDPPCVHHRCGMRDFCASQRLACDAFYHYTRTGRVWHPCSIVRASSTGRKAAFMGMHETPQPSRAIYDKAFPARDPDDLHAQQRGRPVVIVTPGRTDDDEGSR